MDVKSKNVSLVVRELEGVDARVTAAAALGLHRGLLGAVGIVQRQFLSGPRPGKLDVRTTRLRNSIASAVETQGDRIVGKIGTNVVYGAFHEFGFHGIQHVRAHTRAVRQVQFGRGPGGEPLTAEIDNRRVFRDRKGNFIGFKETRKAASSRMKKGLVFVEFVKPHNRKVNYAGRPFVRPGLEKALPMVLNEIVKEIKAAV